MALSRWSVANQGQFLRNFFDVESQALGKAVHSEITSGIVFAAFVLVLVEDEVPLFGHVDLLEAIGKPSFRITSELIGVLGLQDLSRQTIRALHSRRQIIDLLLELLVLLFGVPVPLVNLL